jgi:hypothetical protein
MTSTFPELRLADGCSWGRHRAGRALQRRALGRHRGRPRRAIPRLAGRADRVREPSRSSRSGRLPASVPDSRISTRGETE